MHCCCRKKIVFHKLLREFFLFWSMTWIIDFLCVHVPFTSKNSSINNFSNISLFVIEVVVYGSHVPVLLFFSPRERLVQHNLPIVIFPLQLCARLNLMSFLKCCTFCLTPSWTRLYKKRMFGQYEPVPNVFEMMKENCFYYHVKVYTHFYMIIINQ